MFPEGFQAECHDRVEGAFKGFPSLWRGKQGLRKTPVFQTVPGESTAAYSMHRELQSEDSKCILKAKLLALQPLKS